MNGPQIVLQVRPATLRLYESGKRCNSRCPVGKTRVASYYNNALLVSLRQVSKHRFAILMHAPFEKEL